MLIRQSNLPTSLFSSIRLVLESCVPKEYASVWESSLTFLGSFSYRVNAAVPDLALTSMRVCMMNSSRKQRLVP